MTARSWRVALSALVGALIGVTVAGIGLIWSHGDEHRGTDLHEMLHAAVPLDVGEREILDLKEQAFQRRRAEIEQQLRAANGKLSDAIARDPSWSSDVEAATKGVEKAAGDLQRATLVHVFEMRAGLKPEHRAAYDRVLLDALRRGSQ